MKRIMVSVDLDDNELLDESIREAIRGEAKRIARDEVSKIIDEEVTRIAKSICEEYKKYDGRYAWRDTHIGRMMESAIAKQIAELSVNDDEARKELNARVEKLETYIARRMKDVDKDILNAIDKKVDELIKSAMTDAILRAVFGGEKS